MAKPTPDDLAADGERRLADWGVPAAADVGALVACAGREVAADVAIAHRLGGIPSEESARQLQHMERAALDKSVRKAAKRALYRLQQRGIVVASAPPQTRPAAAMATPLEGYVSAVDGNGDQLVWLLHPQAGGVLHLFAMISDPAGLREVVLQQTTRRAIKALQQDLAQRHEVQLAAIDWRHADFLIRRAFQWARAAGTRMEGDYPALRAQWAHDPVTETSPLAPPAADEAALARSAELLAEPELRTWFRTAEDLAPVLEELGAVQESPLVLNPLQQQERVEAIVTRAIDTAYGGAHREASARRFAELAHYFAATRRSPRAAEAAAVAAALAADVAPHDIPLCSQLVRASLAYFAQLAAQQQADRAKGSLIVTPGQAVRERETR
ncbi:MAG: hypothetical protein U0802_01135 [Candidatus Binatia bacterium]